MYDEINEFGRVMGMEFKVVSPGHIEYFMKCTDKLLATEKHAHGGAIAAMMDGVLGVAALSAVEQENKRVATVEFKINFLSPVALGDQLKGTGKVLRKGKKIIVTEGEIVNQHGEQVAIATGTLSSYHL